MKREFDLIMNRNLSAKDTTTMINAVVLAIFRFAVTALIWTRAQVCGDIRDYIIRWLMQRKYKTQNSTRERIFMKRSIGGRCVLDPVVVHDSIILKVFHYYANNGDQLIREIFRYQHTHAAELKKKRNNTTCKRNNRKEWPNQPDNDEGRRIVCDI